MLNSNEFILPYDHKPNKNDISSMKSINKFSSYSDLSSFITMIKFQRLKKLSINLTKTI